MKREKRYTSVWQLTAMICILLMGLCMEGCASVETLNREASVSQTEATSQDVLTIDGDGMAAPEANVYLYLMQKPYELYYGSHIWEKDYSDEQTWEEWLLDETFRQIEEIEILSRRAEEEGMTLTEEERQEAESQAAVMLETVGAETAERYGMTQTCVTDVYCKSMLAGCYYEKMLDEMEVSLTEEELSACEGVSIIQIFVAADDESHLQEGQSQKELAEELAARAAAGEDFMTLSGNSSSENAQLTLNFDREGYVFETNAWLEQAFVDAAWALEAGEISPVIETSYGYHVLKCTEKNSEALQAQAREAKIEAKKKAKFGELYEQWLSETLCTREDAWQELECLEGI